jgi:hypothetical protein
MIVDKKNFILGILFISIGLLFFYESLFYMSSLQDFSQIPPGFFPSGLSAILAVNGLILIFSSVKWK